MAAIATATLVSPPRRLQTVAAALAMVIVIALASALYMEENGHWVTGMTNYVVWGLPHVFAIFLIVAASGALNVASIASVFGRTTYKPLAPLSGLLAIALLAGGLSVLVLDLGRPDRLLVAMLNQNLSSIFAWNIFLYSGFFAVVGVYLWTMLAKRYSRFTTAAGTAAFVWRLVLTTGTGSIFGFLVARDAFHSAIMAPLFIAMSLAYGLAVFLLVLVALSKLGGPDVPAELIGRLGKLLGILVAAQLYFVAVFHLTNLYAAKGIALERYLLLEGGIYPWLFWVGQVILGGVLPLVLCLGRRTTSASLLLAAALVVLGGLAQVYFIVIGGQSYPMSVLPDWVLHSSFGDGEISRYVPTLPEGLLGLGGMALALVLVLVGCSVLRILPTSLEHHK